MRPVFSLITFLLVPFIEIAGFIIVGSRIGVFPTIALILLSTITGLAIARFQGFNLLQKIKSEAAAGHVPDRALVHGAMLVIAAVLLIIPGFFTSIIGLLLCIPFIRDILWNHYIRKHIVVAASSTQYSQSWNGNPRQPHHPYGNPDDIIDLDPEDFSHAPNDQSPWKQIDDKRQ